MQAYICTICGFLYDEESADTNPEGNLIPFEELDLEWECPSCGSKGTLFKQTVSTRPHDLPTESKNPEETVVEKKNETK